MHFRFTALLFIACIASFSSSADYRLKQWMYPRTPGEYPEDLNLVTRYYGTHYVEEGKFRYKAKETLWSSWYFPINDKSLFSDQSALAKYDKLSRQYFNRATNAREYHERFVFKEYASHWEGFCNPWALSSALFEEPKKSALIDGVCFTPADLKFLLIQTMQKVDPPNRFGQRNNDTYDTIFADIYPEQFHRFLQVQLEERQTAFIMDIEPGVQVWNQPVIEAIGNVSRKPGDDNAVLVSVRISWAKSRLNQKQLQQEQFKGIGFVEQAKTFTYELSGYWLGSRFYFDAGVWTEKSVIAHPDFVTELPSKEFVQKNRGSANPELNTGIVDRILSMAASAPPCTKENE